MTGRVAPWTIDETGWCARAERYDSPNCDARPAGTAIELLVIHSISLPAGRYGGSAVIELFQNRLDCDADPSFADLAGLRVSSHFLVRRDGALCQFVSCQSRAWHAGVSRYGARAGCNDFSIGIELEGIDSAAFEARQYETLSHLVPALCARYPLADVAAHSDIAPGRKTDPGPYFDWPRFLAHGASHLRRDPNPA
jgi:AmpD protein